MQNEPIHFGSVLLSKLHRYRKVNKASGLIVLVGDIEKRNHFIFGTLAHNQMNDLPQSWDHETGEAGDLALTPSQGLAHYTSFLFDPALEMIAYESKVNGVHIKHFISFFEMNYNLSRIESDIVIDPIEVERLNRMTVIKKFHVQIARVENGTIFKNPKSSFHQIIQSADGTNTNVLEFTLKASRLEGGSLTPPRIKQMVRDLLRFKATEEVNKLALTGKESDKSPSKIINFIANRVRLTIKVERKRFTSHFALQERYQKVEKEYTSIRPHLLKAYKGKDS
jgi:hypothetical protein